MPRAFTAVVLFSVSLIVLTGRAIRSSHAHGLNPIQSLPNSSPPRQSIIPPGTIDGSVTPSLIPDSVAYRLFFVTVSEPTLPSASQVRRQRSRLAGAKLTSEEYDNVVAILSNFKAAHDSLQLKYSEIASHGGVIDGNTLNSERDAIVEHTRGELKNHLSRESMASLDAYIQKEKTRMKIIPAPPMGRN